MHRPQLSANPNAASLEGSESVRSRGLPAGLVGKKALCFEARRASELCALFERYGASARSVAAMREVAIEDNPQAIDFVDMLERRQVAAVICLTQVAVEMLVHTVAGARESGQLADLLDRAFVISRGPKPRAALRRLGVVCDSATAEPHTWREVVGCVDELELAEGSCVAVLEHGSSSPRLVSELCARGLEAVCVPLYRWDLPDDRTELITAVRQLAQPDDVDICVFTSGRQVDHVMQMARAEGLAEQLRRRAHAATVVASIGPACSRALHAHDLPVDIEPEHPKMGHLVRELARDVNERIAQKPLRAGAERR